MRIPMLSGKDLDERVARKWTYRYAAKVLRKIYKPYDTEKDRMMEVLIAELERRGVLAPSLKQGLQKRAYLKFKRDQKAENAK